MAKLFTSNTLGGTQQNLSTSYKTLVTALAASSSPRRLQVYHVIVGTTGTPTDFPFDVDISRMTADDGTKTNVTPLALNPADTTFTSVSRANFTAEGTITSTSSVFYAPLNVRATFQWMAAPGSELIAPATASNGLALRSKCASGYTSTVAADLYFEEM